MARKRTHNGSAQARWAEKKRRLGLCRICGQPRNKFKWLCDEHAIEFRIYMRNWRKAKKAAKEAANVAPAS